MNAVDASRKAGLKNKQAIEVNFQDLASGAGNTSNPAQFLPSALSLVAHDLRGPLGTLRSLVELIDAYDKGAQPEKIESCTRRASQIIDGLEEMLNSILERTLKTGDPMKFEPSCLKLNAVLEQVIANNRLAAECEVVLLRQSSTGALPIWGDFQLLYQAIENLIGNAIKHSGRGMQVVCRLRQCKGNAVLSIEDKGTGLSSTDMQKAFRPFTTLSSKTADKSQSWGLGLWIVKLIVEQHGGTVSVLSAGRGKGSTFTVALPLASGFE